MPIQIHKPVHIIGQSRVDTWRTSEKPFSSSKQYVIHRPIQVDARSRVDTWQTLTSQRRARSATEVRNSLVK